MYEYWANIVRVHDGDTVVVDISLGFDLWLKERPIRLCGVSARELSMPGGLEAAVALRDALPAGLAVRIRSQKLDADPATQMSFDRYVAHVMAPTVGDVGTWLVVREWAAIWDGKRKPIPYPPWPRTLTA